MMDAARWSRELALGALALAGAGCGLVLGITDATLDTTIGGASSASGSSSSSSNSSSSSSSSGGAGGAGGGMAGSCAKLGSPFEILASTDVAGDPLDQSSLLLVGATASSNAYVAVGDKVTQTLFVRRVSGDTGNPVAELATYVPAPNSNPRMAVGTHANGTLTLHGHDKTGIGRIDFPMQGGGLGAGVWTSLAQLGCVAGESVQRFAPTFDAQGRLVYAATTVASGGSPAMGTLCWGTESTAPQTIASGMIGDTTGHELQAQSLTLSGQTFLLQTGDEGPGDVELAYGTTTAALAMHHPFSLTADPAAASFLMAAVPLPAGDGALFLAFTVDKLAYAPASLWAGAVKVASYGDLDAMKHVPASGLAKLADFPTTADLVMYGPWASDATRVVSAGASYTLSGVYLAELRRAGDLRVLNWPVYTPASGTDVLTAAATFLGGPKILVTWIERTAGAYAVKGQALSCD